MHTIQTRPNVLIFCVDEMRADHLGCAGHPIVRTPNLDALAARGTRFSRACCNNPICMPARATLFTGLLPRDHGLRINGQTMHPGLPRLPQVMKEAGYRTHSAGKLHLTPWVTKETPLRPDLSPEDMESWKQGLIRTFPTPYFGFDEVDFVGGHGSYVWGPYLEWLKAQGGDAALLSPARGRDRIDGPPPSYTMSLPEELHYNRFISDAAIRTIRRSGDPGAAPFFLWCSYPDPHMPVAPPSPYSGLYDPADVTLPIPAESGPARLPPYYREVLAGRLRANGVDNRNVSEAAMRACLARTYGMITHVDAEVGRVLAALREAGQERNTVVVFTGDHGDMMGDHGLLWKAFYTFSGCIRIPLIVSAPGQAGGPASDALTAQIDLMPSVLDLCGVPEPGADWTARKTPFERGSVAPLRLRPGLSWRPVLEGRADALHRSLVIENDDPTTGLQARALVTATHRLTVYPGTEEGELFDLAADPEERLNLWRERPALRAALTAELLDAYSRHTPAWPVPPWNA